MNIRYVALGFLMMSTITIGWLLVVGHQEQQLFTPTLDTYKSASAAPNQELKTHYHAELSCPLLRAEVSDPNEIRRVVKHEGMLKQPNSTFQAVREPCRLCTRE